MEGIWVLYENRPAHYFCNYKENKRNYTYVGYLFIGYFKDIIIFIIRIIIIGNARN